MVNMFESFRKRTFLALQALRGRNLPRRTGREIPSITEEEIAEAKTFFPLDKFFVFGHARSGTTVLARLIRIHPEVHCNYQAHFFTRPPLLLSLVADEDIGEWLARSSNRWNRGRDLSPVVLRAAADFILERDARLEGVRIVGDKSPNSLMDGESVRQLHKVYPDSRLIFTVRDGRDTIVSHRFQTFIDKPQHLTKEDLQIRADLARDPAPFMNGERSIFTERGLRRAAEGWVRNLDETHKQGQDLFGRNYTSTRFEDLLDDPRSEMARLWSFLGAIPATPLIEEALERELSRNPDAEWQKQQTSSDRDIPQPLKKGVHGSWRELFTSRDRQIFHQIAGDTLKAWGYDETV